MGKLSFTYIEFMSMPVSEIDNWVKIIETQLDDEKAYYESTLRKRPT